MFTIGIKSVEMADKKSKRRVNVYRHLDCFAQTELLTTCKLTFMEGGEGCSKVLI